jgi:hypothetical protein
MAVTFLSAKRSNDPVSQVIYIESMDIIQNGCNKGKNILHKYLFLIRWVLVSRIKIRRLLGSATMLCHSVSRMTNSRGEKHPRTNLRESICNVYV